MTEGLQTPEPTPENIAQKDKYVINLEKTPPVTKEGIAQDLLTADAQIQKQQQTIVETTEGVRNLRQELGLIGEENNIPSIEPSKIDIVDLEKRKVELQIKLQEILQSDVSGKHTEVIDEAKQSKIDWINSKEFARRLKLKEGITDEDVGQVRNWIAGNVTNGITFVLPPDKYREVQEVLSEMSGEESIKTAKGFYASEALKNVPDNVKNSIFLQEVPEKVPRPPMPKEVIIEEIKTGKSVDENILRHEMGHLAQDGLLESDQYEKDWNPNFKEGAPDKDYIGKIRETDARIQALFRAVEGFDPKKEVFGKKQLAILREKLKTNEVNEDTKDLLAHYDDATLIKLANRMPAI